MSDIKLDFATFEPAIKAIGKAGLPVLEQVLTTVVSGATGPFGLLVSPALNLVWPAINNALGIASDSPPEATAAAINADPASAADKLAIVQEEHAYLLADKKEDNATDLASTKQSDDYEITAQAQQISLTQAEVNNPSFFIGGWRPAVAWVCVLGLFTDFASPWVVWSFAIFGVNLPPPPHSPEEVMSLLAALLGLGTLRSYDKQKGTAANAIGSGTTLMPSPPAGAIAAVAKHITKTAKTVAAAPVPILRGLDRHRQ